MNRLGLLFGCLVFGIAGLVVAARRAESGAADALVRLQQSTPGVQQIGHSNISGRIIGGFFQGNGTLLTGLDAGNVALGTLGNARTTGTATNAPNTLVLRNASGSFAAEGITATQFMGGGAGISNVNADLLDGLNSTVFGQLAGSQTWTGTNTFGLQLFHSGGSATAPGLSFSGDSNTGVFSTAADTIGFATGGIERLRIDATGVVQASLFRLTTNAAPGRYLASDVNGNGTWTPFPFSLPPSGSASGDLSGTYPAPTLAVLSSSLAKVSGGLLSVSAGEILSGANLRFSAANPSILADSYTIIPGGAYFNSGTVYFSAEAQLRNGIHNDTGPYLSITGGTSGATYLNGSLGIAKSNPSVPLDVNGAVATNTYMSITSIADSSGNLRFSAGNPYISAPGYLVIPGGAFFNGASSFFGVNSEAEFRGGIHNDSGSFLTISGGTSGISYFTGKVGIGTNAPAEMLEVKGGGGPTSMTFQPGKWYNVDTANKCTIDIPGTGDMLFWDNVHVNNTFTAGTKNFEIDHPLDPLNKFLRHGCIESNEYKNLYDGIVTTDERGYATVTVPDWFAALNENYRYQLTVVEEEDSADFVMAKVARKLKGNSFTIRTSKPNVEVCWQMTGNRKDAYVKANPLVVEEKKPEALRGRYIHPEAFAKLNERP